MDDGIGIEKADLALAVTRHATSKLETLSELEKIMSLGFRGEALASVSAVSKLSIKSKQAEAEQAWMINTGTDTDFANYRAEPEPVAHAQGTTVDVRDLFFNTPARRKFMRTVKTEYRHIDEIVKRIALSQFDVAFKLTHNKKLLRHLPKANTEKAISQRIAKLFSIDFLSNTNKVNFSSDHFSQMGTLRLWGWISTPQWHRKQSDWQYFYVNGRYIKDKLVSHALRQAYQELLPEETFPSYLLYLEIDPRQVDVNVHPTKHEVRFRESRLVHDFIYSALKQALGDDKGYGMGEVSEPVPYDSAPSEDYLNRYSHVNHQSSDNKHGLTHTPHSTNRSEHYYQPKTHSSLGDKLNENQIAEQLNGLKQLYHPPAEEKPAQLPSYFGTSLGCLIPGYIMSQRLSADEPTQIFILHIKRVQQFLLKVLFQPGKQVPLLIPETLSLTELRLSSLLAHQEQLEKWGVDFSQLGDDSLMLRAIPSLCQIPGCKINTERFFSMVAQMFKKKGSVNDSELLDLLMNSIESGMLNLSEQAELLKMLSDWIHQSNEERGFIGNKAVWKVLDEAKIDQLF
ncbi:MAG: hypothetical protein GY694_05035 [Gammaproteobacteria bacterium]|nr:hypothetical protein [Gammaproteobacteria bacterium]